MTDKATREPIDVLPLPEQPDPHPGCKVCGALAGQRDRAQAEGDYSKVSDCNVEIRRHQDPHQDPQLRRRR